MLTLARPVDSLLEIKKSRFLGRVVPVDSPQQGQELLQLLQQAHPQATHVCYVLLCGAQLRQSDDGEPSGTAAAPMLNVLQHKQLDQVLATVVRYFGGIKLGAGGLVRAYSQSISQALMQAEFCEIRSLLACQFVLGFEHETSLRHLAQAQGIAVEVNYGEQLLVRAEAEAEKLQIWLEELRSISRGQVDQQLKFFS